MCCDEISEMMSEWLDGRLRPECSRALWEHIAGCTSCAVEMDALQALDRLLTSAPFVRPPAHLASSVLMRVQHARQARPWALGFFGLVIGAGVCLALIFLPTLLGLLSARGVVPVLMHGVPKVATHLVALAGAVVRTGWVIARRVAEPLIGLSIVAFACLLVLSRLWVRVLRCWGTM